MKLLVIAVGKMRDSRWKKLAREYGDRIGHYLPSDVVEVRESSSSHADTRKEEEGRALLAAVPAGATVIALDELGRDQTSPELAAWIEEKMVRGTRYVAFLIGGPEGLSDEVREAADQIWRLSTMTFPHEMARTVLLEQLYRAMTIVRGEPYHR